MQVSAVFLQWQIQAPLIGNVRTGRKQVEYYFFFFLVGSKEDVCVLCLL